MTLRITGIHAAHHESPVLSDIGITVPERSLACIVGPSGCGKTTLLRVIGGFHHPTHGEICLDGRVLDAPATHLQAQRRRIGFIPQDGALFPHLSVAANIGFGVRRSRRAESVRRLLSLIDMAALADRYPHQLSGGQQQRVAIARALAAEPGVLLLDEPFTALDTALRAQVRADVVDLLRTTGTTAIFVTHDPAEALSIADQVTIMHDGRVLQSGSPAALFAQPVSAIAARALGAANIVPADVRNGIASTQLGELPVPAGSARRSTAVLIRPHQVVVLPAHSRAGMAGRVSHSKFQGPYHRVELAVDGVPGPVVAYAKTAHPIDVAVRLLIEGSVHPLAQ